MGEAPMNGTLLKKGAEASLYLANWDGRHVVIKTRLPKLYRPPQLDQTIRHYRTVHEPQLMHNAKRAGVPTPTIYLVDVENATITMEYVKGKQVKQLLDGLPEAERQTLCVQIGELVAQLHMHGLVHGDLTTSNMILAGDGRIFLVDFGLGDRSEELEAQGVDLHLLRRALQSTHFQHAEACFSAVLSGYANVAGKTRTQEVAAKVREIEKRGRYVAERQAGN
jgi:TP53 regulating kinase and related kinases